MLDSWAIEQGACHLPASTCSQMSAGLYGHLISIGRGHAPASGECNLRPTGVAPKSRIPGAGLWVACLAALLAGRPVSAADKVDVVHLTNGDRLTCEIQKLDRSVLTISTDPLGKASVHWGEVADVASPRQFDVQLASGAQYLGVLMASPPGRLVLRLEGGTTTVLPLADVIRLAPIGASMWSRFDGNVDAGFSFAQAELETHWTLNSTTTYRSPRYRLAATVASQLTAREDGDPISRNSLGLSGHRSLANRWYTIGWGQLQQNQELSLDLRVVSGGGFGRDLVHTNRRLWSAYAGVAYTHERFSDEPASESAEAALGGQLDFFTPGSDDVKITNSIVSYFNVSGRPRIRLELQSAWRHEFLKNFYWSFNGYDSFDGDPPADQKTNDFGVSFALGWRF
jgi:Protein of unknown function, DUF481